MFAASFPVDPAIFFPLYWINELAMARFQGHHVADIVKRLAKQ
jgi:hypothetical protein